MRSIDHFTVIARFTLPKNGSEATSDPALCFSGRCKMQTKVII